MEFERIDRNKLKEMNHYQKKAAFIMRLVGTFIFLYGIFLVINYARMFLSFTGLFYGLIGLVIFLLGKPIGYIVGKGLDD